MLNSTFHKIIVKFLNKEANPSELEKLDDGLKKENNISVFNSFVRIEYLTSIYMSNYDLKKAKQSIDKKVKDVEKKRKINFYKKISIAASVLLVLGLSFFKISEQKGKENEIVKIPAVIEIGTDKAILTLENGDEVPLEKGKNFEKGSLTSNGERLIYSGGKDKSTKSKLSYNYLTIPRGGQFYVELADGTKVWLNSESKLKYPTSFQSGSIREIELVYGEAYMEVSPSSKHNGDSFAVVTGLQHINVLGTEFNIKAYKDEGEVFTTLVGGKIKIQKGQINKILIPNQQARVQNDLDEISIKDVDASQEISWVKGMFSFDEEPLEEIMKSLSRWYDVEVVFESAERKKFVFSGILERTKSINDILKLIEDTSSVEGEVIFEISDKTILIK